jgi:hypothetical protein
MSDQTGTESVTRYVVAAEDERRGIKLRHPPQQIKLSDSQFSNHAREYPSTAGGNDCRSDRENREARH